MGPNGLELLGQYPCVGIKASVGMKFTSKEDLLKGIEDEHRTFVELAGSIPRTRYKEEGVWGDCWTIHDLFAHLTEWEQMFLRWYREGLRGGEPALPAPGFKWNQTPELNQQIFEKHQNRELDDVLAEFKKSFKQIHGVIQKLSDKDLFTPGKYAWTKKNTMGTYMVSATSSHYHWAWKEIRKGFRAKEKAA